MVKTREIALDILLSIEGGKTFSNIALNKLIPEKSERRDESFIRELVYGVVENKLLIDSIIKDTSNIKLKKIHPAIMEILRIGIYQIGFMDKVPNSAAVNESVKLARKRGHRGSVGYVNGTLRNISRNPDIFTSVTDRENPLDYLSIKFSHPRYLVSQWLDEYGYDFTEELLAGNNKRPKLNIRVNKLKISRDQLKFKLEDKGLNCHFGILSDDCLIIDNPSRITELEEFKKGLFTIQDESSMLVGKVMDPKEGSLVLDMCSAPGGKATHMAELMNNKGRVIGRDIYSHKLKLIAENVKRLGIDIIKIENYDALKLDSDLINMVDYCLVDAPCTGFGLIRRKPEIKWNRNKEDIKNLVSLQYRILNTAKNYVKDGGTLLYSTCTISRSENISIVEKFLANNENFQLEEISGIHEKFDVFNTFQKGFLQLYPHIHGTDGFFIAKMKKI